MERHRNWFFTIEYSPDEGGYYAEIYGRDGVTLATTLLMVTRTDARDEARRTIDRHIDK